MEIKLEVVASTCIKQRKPWPRITWLGQEKEAVYLLDDKNINEINLLSGRTKKKIPQLHHLLKNVLVLTTSRNGAWLAGILKTGELFLWNKDHDLIKTVPAIEESKKVVMAAQACSMKLYLYVSGDGKRVLLITPTACVFLWEIVEYNSTSKQPVMGQWSQVIPEASIVLPSAEERETAVHADFIKSEMLGDSCLCCLAFYSEENLMLTFLEIKWQENNFNRTHSLPYRIHWAQQSFSLASLTPRCESLKSRGALLTTFSSDGFALAVAVNQKDPQATQILFMNTLNFTTVSGTLKGCGSKDHRIISKFIRSYWIADMGWTPDCLFLACMLKRGSLILLSCLGELLTLVTHGCSIEFGPAEFIPLHPLITYRSHHSLLQDSAHSRDSSASEDDLLRQRFSVTSHPSLPYLIASDGYIVTVLRFSDMFSPSAFMRSLLLDSAQRLEKLHQTLVTSKSNGKRLHLQLLTSLRANLLQHHQNQRTTPSAIPKFLQEEEETAGLNGEDYDEGSDDDKQFQSNSFTLGSQKTDTCLSDGGRLEFASMFDTIHAVDGSGEKDEFSLELNSILKNLFAAWRMGISKHVQERDTLLSYTTRCITHLFYTLQFAKFSSEHLSKSVKISPWIQCILKCFQQFLTLLRWEAKQRQTVHHLVKLTLHTLKLMLADPQDQPFSSNLLGGFCLLKMVTHHLNSVNTLQFDKLSLFPDVQSDVELDSLVVPVFQYIDWSSHQHFSVLDSILKLSPPPTKLGDNPEKRLTVVWRLLYKHVLCYQTQLTKKVCRSKLPVTEIQIAHEEPRIRALTSCIQAILQSSGEKLEDTLKLKSVTGEEQFLIGSYKESIERWEKALQETKGKGGKRIPFLQTRYYLAILYCHLYNYSLSDAQGLCDHLVNELLNRTLVPVREREGMSDAEQMIRDVHHEAALAVIRSLARFMASYFTNEPLYVLPPHNVDILPSLHVKPDRCPRIVPLQHSMVTNAVRAYSLSCVWTVEYTLDLLLIGGLFPEAVWLAHKLGDWKMAVAIGVAYKLYCQSNDYFPWSQNIELHLPLDVAPTRLFQEKLQSFLGQPMNIESDERDSRLTDPIEEEDSNVLLSSLEEILKAAVMAEADILSETFQLMVDSAKDLSRKFCGLVPDGLYLPAPPLYCPQPTFLSEDEVTDLPLRMERDNRQKVSGVVQRILLLFRAAHCSFPAAQWYMVQLKRARKIMQKIRKKGALPSLSSLPENLLNYSKCHTVFFRPTSSGDHGFDDVSCKTIECFRELCALCWMLHVRERLSDSCRRFQSAREKVEYQKDHEWTKCDASVVEHCLTALQWACRLLPFVRFLNVEELVQDIILSLIGELPPIKKVAEIMVKAFPKPEDVRVSLRDKYHALHQRLRHCVVKGPSSEEMMSVTIQAADKVNQKALKRVLRNIGPHQRSIWEPPEEEAQDPGSFCCDGLSLGTSLSTSTISHLGNLQMYSDAETAGSLSDALPVGEEAKNHNPHQMQGDGKAVLNSAGELTGCKNSTEKLKDFSEKGGCHKSENANDFPNQHILPLVGEWEFERDDDEYIKFLDLFLTYMLERDLISHRDSAIPFLTSFSALLREHELNSLLFDVHTTLKRRQMRTKDQNVFTAGSCYALVFEPSDSKPVSLSDEKKKDSQNQILPVCIQHLATQGSVTRLTGKKGLFGLGPQLIYRAHDSSKEITLSPILTQRWSDQASSVPETAPGHKYIYRVVQDNGFMQRAEAPPETKTKLNNVARLLEWMIRWSDRKLCYEPVSTEPFQDRQPTMHAKTSASAILTSLWLLEQQFCNESYDQNVHFGNAQKQHASPHSSERRSKLEKKKSVDTGYVPSVGAPVGIQDGNAYGEPCENAQRTLPGKQSEKKQRNVMGHSVTQSTETEGIESDDSLIEEMGGCVPEEVDVIPENKELCEDPFAASRSPTISVSIKSVHRKNEQSSVLDRECEEELLTEALEGKFTKLNGSTSCEAVPSSELEAFHVKQFPAFCPPTKAETPSVDMSVSDAQPSFTVVSSIHSHDHVELKKEAIGREPAAQPSNTSDAVRQMLQDEMFKLLQLQQINFMSLMQIVGSSFANLPHTSQHLQQSQFFQQGRSQASNVGGTEAERSLPKYSADDSPQTQMPTLENTWLFNKKSSSAQENCKPCDPRQNENMQTAPNASKASRLPEDQPTGPRLIAPFHQVSARSLPLLSASLNAEKKPKLIPLAKQSINENRFPLLQLKQDYRFQTLNICPVKIPQAVTEHSPQLREAWGPPPPVVKNPQGSQAGRHESESTAHLNLNHYDSDVTRQAREQERKWAETTNKGPFKHLNLDECEKKENVAPLHHLRACLRAEKPQTDHRIPLHKAYENFAQIPLLYLQPCSQSRGPSAFIPVRLAGKELNSPKLSQSTGMPLLHTNLAPLTKFQIPKLIPLQNLIAFEQSCQNRQVPHVGHNDLPEHLQLLKANIKPLEARQDRNNVKRQKRRIQKQTKEKEERHPETAVIQQDDSVVLADMEGKSKAKQAESSYDLSDGHFLPRESSNSLVSRTENLNPEVAISSAELHYLASVGKKLRDLQDSSTNTDPVLKSHQEMQTISEAIVSGPDKKQPVTSVLESEPLLPSVPQTLPPDLYLNLRAAEQPHVTSDLVGRKYIHVIDIENDEHLKNLPDISESAGEPLTTQLEMAEVPTSAKLHHTAASITNAIPPEQFAREDDVFHPESSHEPPEMGERESARDHVTKSLLHEDFINDFSSGQFAKKISRQHFSHKLREIDKQLFALQNVAEKMEKEFSNTKLLVKTIENVGMVADSGEEEVTFCAPGVKLSKEDPSIETERCSSHVIVEDFTEEEESLKRPFSEGNYASLRIPFVSPTASAASLPNVKTCSDFNSRTEELDMSSSEDPLQITGLSGVTDVFTDLVAEGGVSAAELGLTEIQARKISRLSSVVGGHSHKTEKEKQELQTWMKRKRKERLAEYLQKRAEQREKEHSPFHLRKKMPGLTSREIMLQQKRKDEKDKALLSEHHNRRVSQALSLMHELLSDTVRLPSSGPRAPSTAKWSQDFRQPHIPYPKGSSQASLNKTATKVRLGHARSFCGRSRDVARRTAPYRRMAPEMYQGTRKWESIQNRLDWTSQVSDQTTDSVNWRQVQTAVSIEESGDDTVSVWSVPDEIQRILYGSYQGSVPQKKDCSVASVNNFESVSESTSSIISKLDWSAVEAMVANVEDK